MEKKEIDWEERRYELTKMFAKVFLESELKEDDNPLYRKTDCLFIISTSKEYADEVIKILK